MPDQPSSDRDWVVGVDGSDGASAAVEWAVRHVDGRAESLRLVACWRPPTFGPYPGVDPPASSPYDDRALERHALAVARRVADEVAPRVEVAVDASTRRGRAARCLLDASSDAALLIVGRRGRGGFPGLGLGSTSAQCATHSSVPVVVVPDDPVPARHVVVGDDGSPNAAAAVRWAIGFADPDAHIEVVTASDNDGVAAERAEEVVDGPHIVRRVERGRPRDVLGAAAERADLIVVGTRGRGMISAAVLGSVSTWLLHRAAIPVVVVPTD